jgi:hypothetical protein
VTLGDVPLKVQVRILALGSEPVYPFCSNLPQILPAMVARTPPTHIPGYSRARLRRMIAAGNVAAFAIGLWTIFFPTQLYTVGLSLCVLLPLWALALEIRTRGALGFEARRGRRYPLSLASIVIVPALALAVRAGIDLNFESYLPLIAAAVLSALTTLSSGVLIHSLGATSIKSPWPIRESARRRLNPQLELNRLYRTLIRTGHPNRV